MRSVKKIQFKISGEYDGVSVKEYLRKVLGLSGRTLISLKKIPEGITRNGILARTVDILKEGDILELVFDQKGNDLSFEKSPFPVLYEDNFFAAFQKPPGMTIYQCGKVESNMQDVLQQIYGDFTFRPFYRLDKDTSGVLLVAKNAAVMAGTILEKEYFAFCQGNVPDSGMIHMPIGCDSESKIVRKVGIGQDACTLFQKICTRNEISLVRFVLKTGRTHQIRAHMSFLGHPLCGDDLYGGSLSRINRQALHCGRCHIKNTTVGVDLVVSCPFPDDMRDAFSEFDTCFL